MSRYQSPWTKITLQIESLETRWVPTTLTPTRFGDGGPGSGSLRAAILQFNADTGTDDDILQLEAGTYALTLQNRGGVHETAGLSGDLNLAQTSHRWIIQGTGSSGENATILDASRLQDRVFEIVNPGIQVMFQDLVIQGGLAQDNGADGALAGQSNALGGGLLNNGGDVTLDGVVLQNNVARGGDGPNSGQDGHSAQGGGLYSTGGSITIADSTIASNQATGGRGASGGSCGSSGIGGAGQGGGLYTSGSVLSISGSTITNNQATGGRGGDGGFCGSEGDTLSGFGVDGGVSQGGGLYLNGGMLTLTDSTISSNILRGGRGGDGLAGGYGGVSQGGGLYLSGMLNAINSTISTNNVYGGSGGGGNPFLGGGGGGGVSQGGGLWVATGTTAQISFSTIATNQATGGTHGVGNTNGHDGPATGGGVDSQGLLQTRDTLLAGNLVDGSGTNSGPDLAGDLGSLGHNLVGNSDGGSGFDATDLLDVDPLLGPLQDNGGPTQTMVLLPGSPALDAGNPNQMGTTDQRGVVRTGGVNIGAYQASATAFLVSAPDTVTAGVPFDVTVTAVDPFGQVAVGYTGTVTFSTTDTDPGVVLPANYTFTPDDGGQHTFTDTGLGGTTLITPGDQTLTVMDTVDNTITGSALITVGSSAPGAGSHGLGQPPPPGGVQESASQVSESPQPTKHVVDRWFASLDQWDLSFTLPLSRRRARPGTEVREPDRCPEEWRRQPACPESADVPATPDRPDRLGRRHYDGVGVRAAAGPVLRR